MHQNSLTFHMTMMMMFMMMMLFMMIMEFMMIMMFMMMMLFMMITMFMQFRVCTPQLNFTQLISVHYADHANPSSTLLNTPYG